MTLRTVDENGMTSCCNAYTTFSMDDGVECCKACWEEVVPASERIEITLPPKEVTR